MERHLYDSPEGKAIIAQIDTISAKGTARREACRDTFLRNIKPAAFDWLTDDERDELHTLQLQIRPLSQQEARERVQAKREARKLEQAEPVKTYPLVWTPDGLQYNFSATPDSPVQPNLF